MALPAIFCSQCDTLILDASQCPACHWQRPVMTGEVGQPVWAVALEVKLPRKESHPVAAGDFAFIPTDAGQIVALHTGAAKVEEAIKWRHQPDPRYRCHRVAVWDEYLLLGSEYTGGFPAPQGELILLSAKNGDEVWRYPVEGPSLSVPVVRDEVAYFTINTGWLYAVDLANRQELWRQRIEPNPAWSWAPAAPLLTATGLLVLPGRCDQLIAFDIDRQEIAWTFPAGAWFPDTPFGVDGLIYARCWDRHVYALDAASGQAVWRYKAPRDFSSDLWADGKFVYIGAKDYQAGADSGDRAYALYILDRQTGQRVGRYEVQGHILARPVATEQTVFFATDDRSRERNIESRGTLYALDIRNLASQKLLWKPCEVEQRFQSDLLLMNDLIIAGTRQGAVYAIRRRAIETTPEAPQVYVERGAWEDAAIAHALQGEYTQAAEIYAQELAQPLKAGLLYFKAGEHRRVIELLGPSEEEAERVLAIGAAHALSDSQERAEILCGLGEYLVAASVYKEAGDWAKAGDCYREAQAWEEARAAYAQAGVWDKWNELSRKLEQWEDMVARFMEAGEYAQAAEIYAEEMGRFAKAADCYDRADMHAEAFAAYRRVDPETMTEAVQRRLAELAEELGEIEMALETYQVVGELAKAAELAETTGHYQKALALYEQVGPRRKMAEILEKLARYVDAAEIFVQEELWGRAAENLEQQVEQVIKRMGGVRHVRRNPEVEKWLNRAVVLFEDEHEISETEGDRDFFYRGAERCRKKLTKLRREPLLQIRFETERLILNQSSVVQCEIENVGWGIARNLTLLVNSPHAQHPITPLPLGDLRRDQKVLNAFTVVPNVAGAMMLQITLQGQTRSNELQEFPIEGGSTVILDPQTGPGLAVQPETELGSLWDESSAGSSEEVDSGVVSQAELRQQEINSLRRQLAQHHSNLNKLQEDAALYGAGEVPLRLQNQIEAEQKAIAEIEARL
jgi:outer membrane protein assembly factor BamB